MSNEREFLIEQLLTRIEQAAAVSLTDDASCPAVTMLIDTLLEQASPQATRRVKATVFPPKGQTPSRRR
jgi:hypothetical protein